MTRTCRILSPKTKQQRGMRFRALAAQRSRRTVHLCARSSVCLLIMARCSWFALRNNSKGRHTSGRREQEEDERGGHEGEQ